MREIIINKKGFLSASIDTFKESVDKKGVVISGLLLPKDKISRNGVLYDWESIKKHHKELIGKKVMFNHIIDTDLAPVGKVIHSFLIDESTSKYPIPGWYYEANLNPNNEYTKSVLRGDLDQVSIQVMADKAIEESVDDINYQRAFIGSILEMSLVNVPGFEQTTVEVLVAEAFKMKEGYGDDTKIVPYKNYDIELVYHKRGVDAFIRPKGNKMKSFDDTSGKDEKTALLHAKSMIDSGNVEKEGFKMKEEVNTTNADGAIQPTKESIKKQGYDERTINDVKKQLALEVKAGKITQDEATKYIEDINTTNADGAIQPTNGPDGTGPYGKGNGPGQGKADGSGLEKDFKDEGLDQCPNCGGTNFMRLKSGQLQCGKCKRLLVEESFSSKENMEGNKMDEENKNPPVEKTPVEEQAPVEETKPVEEKPADEAPKEAEKPAEEKPAEKSESLKEQDEVSQEEEPKEPEATKQEPIKEAEETEEEPVKEAEETEEEPLKEEMTDMDKVTEILEKLVADVAELKAKAGLTEEAPVDDEEVIEEQAPEGEQPEGEEKKEEQVEEEEDEIVEEPSAAESFNPGKILFESVKETDDKFKEAVKTALR